MKQKTLKVWYWVITILFAAFMAFSGVMGLIGSEQGNAVLIDLGYPLYLNIIIGIAKVLGAIVLVQPKFPTLKEWAYAGFAIDIIGASASFGLNGSGIGPTLSPLIFLAVMFLSYFLWKKAYPTKLISK